MPFAELLATTEQVPAVVRLTFIPETLQPLEVVTTDLVPATDPPEVVTVNAVPTTPARAVLDINKVG